MKWYVLQAYIRSAAGGSWHDIRMLTDLPLLKEVARRLREDSGRIVRIIRVLDE